MNQTLTSYATSDAYGAELSLAVNLNFVQNSQSVGGYQELGLVTTVLADTRRSIDYSFWSENAATSFNSIVGNLGSTLSVADNSGVCVSFPSPQWYYGGWYHQLWISDNGYVVFDSNACTDTTGKFNRPTPPGAIPSNTDGGIDSFIAPFWRDFRGATVKYGTYPDVYSKTRSFFGVAWINVQDASRSKQSFLLGIENYPAANSGDPIIEFVYGTAKYGNGLPYGIGMEDQAGRRGEKVDPAVNSIANGKRIVFSPYSDKNDNVIRWVKVSASKWATSPSVNDATAQIDIKGQGSYLPAGINIVPQPSTELLYTHYPSDAGAWHTVFSWAGQQMFEKIPYTDKLLSVYDLLTDLGPACDTANPNHQPDPECGVSNPATPGNGLQTAYSRNSGMEASLSTGHFLKYRPWSLVLLPVFVWSYDPTVAHYVDISAQIMLENFRYSTVTTITTQTITLRMNPLFSCLSENPGAHWSGRTTPDRHSYDFSLSCGDHSTVYHIDSTKASGESDYLMIGWAKTTSYTDNDYKTDSQGRLTVQGFFKSDGPAGDRILNAYAIDSKRVGWDGVWRNDNLDNIIKTVPLVTNADPTGWNYKQVLVDLGPSYAGWPIKIGLGRPVDAVGTSISVEWQGPGGNADMVLTGPPPPRLTATASGTPSAGTAPLVVVLTGGAANGVPPYSWHWDFGDSSASTEQSPSHTYASPGSYTAMLTVHDSSPLQIPAWANVTTTVNPNQLTAQIDATPTSGVVPVNVQFLCGSTGGVSPYYCAWDFGDGATDPNNYHPWHVYTAAGAFTAKVTVTDSARPPQTATATQTITATWPPLSAAASGTPTSGTAPVTVQFAASGSGGVPPYSYQWHFGDGTGVNAQNPIYTYNSAGTYNAWVYVWDSVSQIVSRGVTVTVSPPLVYYTLVFTNNVDGNVSLNNVVKQSGSYRYASGVFVTGEVMDVTYCYTFDGWVLDGVSQVPKQYTITFQMNANHSLTAKGHHITKCTAAPLGTQRWSAVSLKPASEADHRTLSGITRTVASMAKVADWKCGLPPSPLLAPAERGPGRCARSL